MKVSTTGSEEAGDTCGECGKVSWILLNCFVLFSS
jgi:hypothetical protein